MDALKKLAWLAEKAKCSAELFSTSTVQKSFTTRGTSLKDKKTAFIQGHALRVIKDQGLGFTFFERESEFEDAMKRALKLAKLCEKGDYRFAEGRGSSAKFSSREKLEDEEAVETLQEMASAAREAAKEARVEVRPEIHALSHSTSATTLATSEGSLVRQSFTRYYARSSCFAEASEGSDSQASSAMDFSPREVAANAALYAATMHGSRKAPPGLQEVVLDVRALGDFLHLFLAFNFSGESLRKGTTRVKPGAEIAGKGMAVYDDPLLKRGLNSAEYDDEGFKTRKLALLKRGIAESFLFDMATASKFAKPGSAKPSSAKPRSAKPGFARPGNGWRSSYKSQPSPGASNIVIPPGGVEDSIAECRHGTYVASFLVVGANPVTGDFSLPLLTAFSIEKGELSRGVAGATLVGNFFDVFKEMEFERKQWKYHDVIAPRAKFRAKIVA